MKPMVAMVSNTKKLRKKRLEFFISVRGGVWGVAGLPQARSDRAWKFYAKDALNA